MSIAGVWERPLKVSLDALGSPAPTSACGRHTAHQPRTGVWAHRCVGLAEHCVNMRGHAWTHIRAKEGVRCGLPVQLRRTRLRQTSPAVSALRATTLSAQQVHRSALAHAGGARATRRMGTWRRHTFTCVLDQFE